MQCHVFGQSNCSIAWMDVEDSPVRYVQQLVEQNQSKGPPGQYFRMTIPYSGQVRMVLVIQKLGADTHRQDLQIAIRIRSDNGRHARRMCIASPVLMKVIHRYSCHSISKETGSRSSAFQVTQWRHADEEASCYESLLNQGSRPKVSLDPPCCEGPTISNDVCYDVGTSKPEGPAKLTTSEDNEKSLW